MNLEGATFLVTGAGRRLGRAIALGLAERGASIVVHYGGSRDGAEEAADSVRGMGGDAWTLQADLADARSVEALAAGVAAGPGGLDGLVNSAASFVDSSVESLDAAAWDAIMAVNLRAPFLLTRVFLPHLRASHERRGTPAAVVNMVDLSALHSWPGYTVHGVSKAGLLHLTRTLACELAPAVRVNAVIPGAILPAPELDPESDEWRTWGERLPLGRTGSPADVVAAIRFLIASDFVTGVALPVDGGENLIGSAARRRGS